MKTLLLFLIIPALTFCQNPSPNYLFGKIELDPKNAIFGSDKNDPGLNYIASLGYRFEGGFQIQFSYESFDEIKYKATYLEAGHFFRSNKKLQPGITASAGFVFRDVNWTRYQSCTLSLSGNLKYHLTGWIAATAKFEGRYRGDLQKVIPSGYVGVEFKVF